MNSHPEPSPAALDEAAILARFVQGEGDAEGLLAYALHRHALLAFRQEFASRTGAAPSAEAENAFLIGETSPHRIATYRAEAAAQLASRSPAAAKEAMPAKPRRRWLALFDGPPMLVPDQPEKVNWKGLIYRLTVLLLAVVATALLLRVLFVSKI